MKREVSPVFMAVICIVIVGVIVLVYWRSSVPEGVKTDKPPKPNPPGGIPTRNWPGGAGSPQGAAPASE